MADWFPLHSHTHYSLLDGLQKAHQVAKRVVQCGYGGSAVTDHGTIAGAASFQKGLKNACKCGHEKKSHSSTRCVIPGCTCMGFEKTKLKAILGEEFYLSAQDASIKDATNRRLSHLPLLAKSLKGWKNLIKASSASQKPEFFYYKPRLDLERLAAFSGGEFVCFSGHVGSDMADVLFTDIRAAYGAQTYEAARSFVRSDWKKAATDLACRYRDLFGKENFYLEIQRLDHKNMPCQDVISNILRYISKQTGIPCVATADSHYSTMQDAEDQRVLLCSALETTFAEVERKAAAGEDVTLGGFFRSKRYHIPTYEEMEELHEPQELMNSLKIADMCEDYDITGQPMLPEFPCPDGLKPDDYMRVLAKQGWERKILPKVVDGRVWTERGNSHYSEGSDRISFTVEEYRNRLENEFKVIFEAGLSGYFLIVQDYCAYARSKGKVGKGRGSAAGCLVSYLTGITDVDPLAYNLIFERFYNAGRNSPGHIEFPDIDSDFEKFRRDDVIDYVRHKYGASRVAQMTTFTRMQGRGAIKDVLRAWGDTSFEEMNKITACIPDEHEIAEDLQEMLEERGESSILRWTLENEGDGLKPWCFVDKDGKLDGPLADRFEQAIRLEGTFRSPGKHPSGLIISAVDLSEVVPMCQDKSTGELIVAVDMRDAAAVGLIKFDLLANAALDKVRYCMGVVRNGGRAA